MLHTYTGKKCCARAIFPPLAGRLCSEQDFTYGQVRLDLSEPVRSPALGGNALLRVFPRHRYATLGLTANNSHFHFSSGITHWEMRAMRSFHHTEKCEMHNTKCGLLNEKWRLALRALRHGPEHRVFNGSCNILKIKNDTVKLLGGLSWIDADSLSDMIPVS